MVRKLDIQVARRAVAVAFAATLCVLRVFANDGFDDGVDRSDPKFVTASLLVIDPGDELFSCVGHAVIRLECPTFKLDYCFSYESERAVDRLPAFFAGRLKMGMFAIPTEEFLVEYRKDGRGVRQYVLNLPPEVKQRLWKHMDELAAVGPNLPYDYIRRGCAKSVLDCLRSAAAPLSIVVPKTELTIREVFWNETHEVFPWNIFFILGIGGTESDVSIDAGTPRELVRLLRSSTLIGVPLLTDEGSELLPGTRSWKHGLLTPFVAAWLVFVLAAVAAVANWRRVRWAFLAVQALAGCFFVYLVSASHLPNSAWNWLLVPFNPVMPALACWRRFRAVRWALGAYVAALLNWIVMMLFVPHAKTDPAFIVLGGAMALVYAATVGENRLFKFLRRGSDAGSEGV